MFQIKNNTSFRSPQLVLDSPLCSSLDSSWSAQSISLHNCSALVWPSFSSWARLEQYDWLFFFLIFFLCICVYISFSPYRFSNFSASSESHAQLLITKGNNPVGQWFPVLSRGGWLFPPSCSTLLLSPLKSILFCFLLSGEKSMFLLSQYVRPQSLWVASIMALNGWTFPTPSTFIFPSGWIKEQAFPWFCSYYAC